ncbi:MAG TPA: ATP-dependent DNA helicase RecG, partial [Dermacoccus sp.]|nr:ATP-dependent DNA helicase RecG [Dermacoccus sp.]
SEPVAPGLVDGPDAHGAGEGDAAARPIGVVDLIDEMRRLPALAGLRIGLMHGRLPAEEKDDVMRRFGAGEVDVLVATTV